MNDQVAAAPRVHLRLAQDDTTAGPAPVVVLAQGEAVPEGVDGSSLARLVRAGAVVDVPVPARPTPSAKPAKTAEE